MMGETDRVAAGQETSRRKKEAKGKPPRFEYVQQRHERGHHYISIPVEGLPLIRRYTKRRSIYELLFCRSFIRINTIIVTLADAIAGGL
jgi:hypothetical protein